MRRPSALAALFLTVFVDLLGFGIVLPLLPRYAETMRASDAAIGLLMASFSAMQFLFAPLWGRLSDRVGRRPVLLLGLFGSVLSYTLFAVADTLALLFASRVAAGVFGATIGAAQAYIADVTEASERGRGMALIGAAFGLGFTFGPAMGGLAHHHFGPAAPGVAAASLSLAAFLFAWRALPEPERRGAGPRAPSRFAALARALALPTVPLLLALQVVATIAFAGFESTLARYTRARWGYDASENGFLFTYVGVCLLVSQGFLVRRILPRAGERNLVALGALALAAGLLAVAAASGTAAALASLPLVVLGFSMITPSLASLLSLATPPAMHGEIFGVSQSGLSLARVVGPLLGNLLFQRDPGAPYLTGAAIMALACAGGLALRAKAPA
jgi:DHA1 family tetracycline resistance protein-like MFS transporter